VAELWDKFKFLLLRFYRRRKRTIILINVIIVVLILFRNPILRGVGSFLIVETPPQKVDAIFVLGGNLLDRPLKAKELYDEGYASKIFTVGGNYSQRELALNNGDTIIDLCDAIVSQEFLMGQGVAFEDVQAIPYGTSTKEESEHILNQCLKSKFDSIIVVTDKFHTRRVSNVFIDYFKKEGITVILQGCSNREYEEDLWWKSEQGLVMVNNEYLKLVYYMLKGY